MVVTGMRQMWIGGDLGLSSSIAFGRLSSSRGGLYATLRVDDVRVCHRRGCVRAIRQPVSATRPTDGRRSRVVADD